MRTLLYPTLDHSQSEALRRFVASSSQAQFLGYHCPDYQEGMAAILGDACRHLITFDADSSIAGYMPYREKSGAHGSVINALPFFGPNGLMLARDDVARTSLLDAFTAAIGRDDVLSAVVYTPFLEEPARFADILKPHRRIERFTQYLHLPSCSAWPKKRRGDLKRATLGGFTLREAIQEDAADIYRIYCENCLEAGIPQKPRAYIDLTLALSLGSAADGQPTWSSPLWLVAERAGRVVAGLLAIRGSQTMSYTLPFAEAIVRADQPLALLIDDAIQRAKESGLTYWNFESSPQVDDNVFKYKERWGARLSTYEVFILYPNGKDRVEALDVAELKRSYPYYFVRPY